jgi:hypothetical protein
VCISVRSEDKRFAVNVPTETWNKAIALANRYGASVSCSTTGILSCYEAQRIYQAWNNVLGNDVSDDYTEWLQERQRIYLMAMFVVMGTGGQVFYGN